MLPPRAIDHLTKNPLTPSVRSPFSSCWSKRIPKHYRLLLFLLFTNPCPHRYGMSVRIAEDTVHFHMKGLEVLQCGSDLKDSSLRISSHGTTKCYKSVWRREAINNSVYLACTFDWRIDAITLKLRKGACWVQFLCCLILELFMFL